MDSGSDSGKEQDVRSRVSWRLVHAVREECSQVKCSQGESSPACQRCDATGETQVRAEKPSPEETEPRDERGERVRER